MAGKQVNFEIGVDASDGVRGLRDFSKAAEKAGKDAAKSLEDTASAGDKARAAIKTMAEAFDTELRDAAKAADALGKALGPELTSRMDIDQVVQDLGKMGVSFDEIQADADKFATTLREVDGIRLQQVNDGLGDTSRKLRQSKTDTDELSHSARGANSALANMIGNASQDLGAFVGIADSAGVAIGQMAEYASDATLDGERLGSALTSMAKVAGPIAALSVVVGLASKAFGNFQKRQQEVAQNTRETAEAMAEITGAAKELEGVLEDVGEQGEDFGDILLAALGPDKLGDALTSAHKLGIEITDLGDLIAGLGDAGTAQGFAKFVSLIEESTGVSHDAATAIAELLTAAGTDFSSFQVAAQNDMRITRELTADQIAGLEDVLSLYGDITQVAKDTSINKAAQEQLDLVDDTVEGLEAINEARDRLAERGILDPSAIEVATELYNGIINVGEGLDESAEAGKRWERIQQGFVDETNAAVEATKAHVEQLAELSDELHDVVFQTTAAQERVEAWDTAVAKIRELSDLDTATQLGSIADGIDSIGEAVEAAGSAAEGVDLIPESLGEILAQPDEIRAITEQIAGLADVVNTDLSEAFEFGGPGGVRKVAAELRADIVPQLEAMGLSAQQVQDILTNLGLTDEQVNIRIKMSGEEQARITLTQMQGVIESLPPEVQLQIAADFVSDPTKALQEAIDALEAEGVEIPAVLQANADDLQAQVDAVELPPAEVPLEAQVGDLGEQIDAERAKQEQLPVTLKAVADVHKANDDLDKTSEDRDAKITADPHTDAANDALNATAAGDKAKNVGRIAPITAVAAVAVANLLLNLVARDRTADINTQVNGANAANLLLDLVARDRFADIFVRTHGAAAASATVSSVPGVTATAAPMALGAPTAQPQTLSSGGGVAVLTAPAPTTNVANVTIQAGVIGNRFEVQRAVQRALRQGQRLNGRRN